jgi:alkylated DNA repair protein (DNA oxidative demethylase)
MTEDPRQAELFDEPPRTDLGPGARLLPGFAAPVAPLLIEQIVRLTVDAPFRHLTVPGGHVMSVAMSNCGDLGWISDRAGYRYADRDPLSGRRWPPMPGAWFDLAQAVAAQAGYEGFQPNACLINRYRPGARMGLHQDRDEPDLSAPIVSVSLGLPAMFLWGGPVRRDRARRLALLHGDVVVWGGPARLAFHGVAPLKDGDHPLTGPVRYNLTFRRAG